MADTGTEGKKVEILTSKVQLDKYVDFAGEASKRSRWVLLVLLIASVFGFSAFLTSREGAWSWHRLENLNKALACANHKANCTPDEAVALLDFLRRWEYISDADRVTILSSHDFSKIEISTTELEAHIQHQRQVIMDRVALQTAPFIGFTFDVNDLGIVTAVAYVSLLTVLMLALRREAHNISMLKKYASDHNCSIEAWTLVAMRQVFTISENRSSPNVPPTRSSKLLENIDSIILITPLLVQFAISLMDWETRGTGNLLSSTGMIVLTVVEAASIVLIIWLIVLCRRELTTLQSILGNQWTG